MKAYIIEYWENSEGLELTGLDELLKTCILADSKKEAHQKFDKKFPYKLINETIEMEVIG